ncbi:uncharacterized protein K452DRAFT_329721 [Aplosporella prunicola CBS 121167]|uniref:BSD domain-containing protein n=1 Tax=Aplosporella prunicola CBS 121167 TaxID=1176127 RepID=A0A6A6B0Z6_9PEZI|nr:uncharacterized protein K452DRAFT_329721 [Aplosporella prunicola CBS 121167]KAF2136401.1 hypothetical protein K452DRAFT_329721 [Aplosporella prunicola CBS 121167]
MDVAYDYIQEESFPDDDQHPKDAPKPEAAPPQNSFNNEVQEAYKAISSSPWAARIGGFWGTVKKQGESYYETARQQSTPALEQASKGLTDLRSTLTTHARNISTNLPQLPAEGGGEASSAATSTRTITDKDGNTIEVSAAATVPENPTTAHAERSENLSADIVKEAEGMLSLLRFEGAKRLKDIQKAEDAADEALLKFGTNIRDFLRDAVTITGPGSEGAGGADAAGQSSKVLFESKDVDGKRVIHTTRFDAQLHVIHSSLDSFVHDPESPEWAKWAAEFDIDKKTADIAKDLEKYKELRRAMEALVPEKVEYTPFWTRYYFLRHVIESEEQRRREMLKASATATTENEPSWDDDSDAEAETPNAGANAGTDSTSKPATPNPLAASKETLKPAAPAEKPKNATDALREHDLHSQPDSDASYDLVSGATSRAPGSPGEEKKRVDVEAKGQVEESDEEDWE